MRQNSGEYSYPDGGDRLTVELIRTREPFEGYWEASERLVLELALAELSHAVAGVAFPRMLDAGAGYGRSLALFEPLFRQITVVEPDRDRLAGAEDAATAGGCGGKVRFVHGKAEDHEAGEPYAFVLCSYVLQHVHTDSVVPMLRRFAELLSPGGRLLIFASHSTKGRDYFVESGLRGGELYEREIDRARFNRLMNNREGLLPIRFLTRRSMEEMLAEAGLSALQFRCFHVLDRRQGLPAGIERDDYVNASAARQAEFGRDMYLMAGLRAQRQAGTAPAPEPLPGGQ